jgi:hypothetical protein
MTRARKGKRSFFTPFTLFSYIAYIYCVLLLPDVIDRGFVQDDPDADIWYLDVSLSKEASVHAWIFSPHSLSFSHSLFTVI